MTPSAPQSTPQPEPVPQQRTDAIETALLALLGRLDRLQPLGEATAAQAGALTQRAAPAMALADELAKIGRGQGKAIEPAVEDARTRAAAQAKALKSATVQIRMLSLHSLGLAEATHLADRDLTAASAARAELIEAATKASTSGHEQFAAWSQWLSTRVERWKPPATDKGKALPLEKIMQLLPDLAEEPSPAGVTAHGATSPAQRSRVDDDPDGDALDMDS